MLPRNPPPGNHGQAVSEQMLVFPFKGANVALTVIVNLDFPVFYFRHLPIVYGFLYVFICF